MELQTPLRDGTTITFAGGSLTAMARVLFSTSQGDGSIVVTDRTPFHPQSLTWPDQPGDRGFVTLADGRRATVLDSCEGLLNRTTGILFTGDSARGIKRNEPDIHAVVLHVLEDDLAPVMGDEVVLTVEKAYRDALSLQHTGVHLAALALNQCAAPFWNKETDHLDSLGAPNLDKAAVTRSEITTTSSADLYRVGKSLRKRGFDLTAFLSDLPERTSTLNKILHYMMTDPAPVLLTPAEGPLSERRLWSTHLNGTKVSIPCGGTHVAHLSQIGEVSVQLAIAEDGFVMMTRCTIGTST